TASREETRQKDAGGKNALNTSAVSERSGLTYDGSGRLINYAQSNTDPLGLISHSSWAGVYDGRGLILGSEERMTDARGNASVRSQSDILYDAAGRAMSYIQDTLDSLGVRSRTERSGTIYDGAGLVAGYTEDGSSLTSDNIRTDTHAKRSGMAYDLSG